MKHQVKVTFKDGTFKLETFDSHAHMIAYTEYIISALKDFVAKAEIVEDKEEPNENHS